MCTDTFKMTITLDFKMIYSLFDDNTAAEVVKAIHLYPDYTPNCKKELWNYIESALKQKETIKQNLKEKAKARWEKTKATKADEVTTTVVEPKEEIVTPDVVEDTKEEPEPYVEPIAVEKMEDVLNKQEETLKEDTKVTPEVEVTTTVVETPKPSPEPLIKKQDVYTYQNTGNPYLYRPVEDADTPEQKNVDEQWQLFDKAAWELKDSTNVTQLEQFLLKMDTWWKKFGTMELNPDYNMAHHLIKNRIADLKGIPV